MKRLKKERKGSVVAADRQAAQQRMDEAAFRRGHRPANFKPIRG